MTYRVELAFKAERDLDCILNWIQKRSKQGAVTWFRRWRKLLVKLSKRPNSFHFAPENEDHDEEIRQAVFKTRRGLPYRALFIIRGDVVYITNLRGPGQDLVDPADIQGPNG